jgi:hypothetical protein
MWVVSFTTRPLYAQGKNPQYPLDRRLGGSQSRSKQGVEEKNPHPPPEIEPSSSDRLTRSWSLYWLSYLQHPESVILLYSERPSLAQVQLQCCRSILSCVGSFVWQPMLPYIRRGDILMELYSSGSVATLIMCSLETCMFKVPRVS